MRGLLRSPRIRPTAHDVGCRLSLDAYSTPRDEHEGQRVGPVDGPLDGLCVKCMAEVNLGQAEVAAASDVGLSTGEFDVG